MFAPGSPRARWPSVRRIPRHGEIVRKTAVYGLAVAVRRDSRKRGSTSDSVGAYDLTK
jgi:hypothetical protein